MQLYNAVFTTQKGALTAVIRACTRQDLPTTVILKGKAKPVYRRGELVGYHAVYPRKEGGFDIVKETFDGSQKCYHFN
jgi:hypothetical protein